MVGNGTCMKRWGLRASSLSAGTKADAGQNASYNHLTPNVLYIMLAAGHYFLRYLTNDSVKLANKIMLIIF